VEIKVDQLFLNEIYIQDNPLRSHRFETAIKMENEKHEENDEDYDS